MKFFNVFYLKWTLIYFSKKGSISVMIFSFFQYLRICFVIENKRHIFESVIPRYLIQGIVVDSDFYGQTST